jgi:hypothetical protein
VAGAFEEARREHAGDDRPAQEDPRPAAGEAFEVVDQLAEIALAQVARGPLDLFLRARSRKRHAIRGANVVNNLAGLPRRPDDRERGSGEA